MNDLEYILEVGTPLVGVPASYSLGVIKADSQLKTAIERVHKTMFGREICGSCKDRHLDGLVAILLKPKNEIKEIMGKKLNTKFALLRGVLVRDAVNADARLTMTANNISDELALYHLATNYDNVIGLFARTPDNVDELVKNKREELKKQAKASKDNSKGAAQVKAALQAEGSKIIEDAKKEAAKITAEANKKAKATIAEADKDAKALRSDEKLVSEITDKVSAMYTDEVNKLAKQNALYVDIMKAYKIDIETEVSTRTK